MQISLRALITLIHGMLFGAFFLLAAYGMVMELCWSNGADSWAVMPARVARLRRYYLMGVVAVGWAAVLTGAYIIYPWYRAVPPPGLAGLSLYPRYLLKSNPGTAGWHDLGMEWKEHIAWIAPIAMSMVAHVLNQYQRSWREHPQVRTGVLVFALAAFGAAGVAGFFGAMLNKYAPVSGGPDIHLQGRAQ